MADDVVYVRGKSGTDVNLWDDTALINAYDKAINSYKKLNGHIAKETNETLHKAKKKNIPGWKVGSKCKAHYSEDGLLYDAIIVAINKNLGMCTVKYLYYNNEETKMLSDLVKIEKSKNSKADNSTRHNSDDNSDVSNITSASFKKLLPNCPPPPMPDISTITNEKDALYGMLISWYMSGYYTGYYKAGIVKAILKNAT
ncbi:hypothetical protein HELRODRAFT_158469 [Helobdella robusta]|uniref:Tudor domain-containing protein n=1 Tax=Helobdella robusta TaxID=6412 RepID=T1EMU0_HELRO|nr:hypothetical protein HELRODRAFT_158469 [Helobdella robusta]ESO12061.1 hypothetical protein HELRODRAFT_158469 [Helobdella robusta]